MDGSAEVFDVATDDMVKLRGQTVTISEIVPNGKYRILELAYRVWTDEMFEGLHISDIPTLGDLI